MRRHTERGGGSKPLDYNNLIVWATDKRSGRRSSVTFEFENPDYLARIDGLPHNLLQSGINDPQEIKVAQSKLRSLVEKQPVYVKKASQMPHV